MKKKMMILLLAGLLVLEVPMTSFAVAPISVITVTPQGDTVVESGVAYRECSDEVAQEYVSDTVGKLAKVFEIEEGGFVGDVEKDYTVTANYSQGTEGATYVTEGFRKGQTCDEDCGIRMIYHGATVLKNYGNIHQSEGLIGILPEEKEPTSEELEAYFCSGNFGTLNTNEERGVITINHEGATVKENDGTVMVNEGTVESNTGIVESNELTGVITNGAGGFVDYNHGTVHNATKSLDGLIYKENGDTYYGVTCVYSDYSVCESLLAGAGYRVTEGDKKSGYDFVKWTVADPEGKKSYCFYVGEVINVASPLLLTAIYRLAEEDTKASFTGTADTPVTGGIWVVSPGGEWSFHANGSFKNTWGCITLPGGKTGWFYFDGYGIMATGWKEIGGKWYYFNEVHDGTYGMMLSGTVTPDGQQVGADGARL